jgi:hypothetical protein
MAFNHYNLSEEQLKNHLSKISTIVNDIKTVNEKFLENSTYFTYRISKAYKDYDFIIENIYEIKCGIDEDTTSHSIGNDGTLLIRINNC